MSSSGIRSNRGDIYQTLIAFDWALTVLTDPEFQWLEIDSVTDQVDDIVIGKSDGSRICCQCKKNQGDFSAWSIADLAGELVKASLELAKNQKARVKFYSRSEFGALAKLREYSTLYSNEVDYHANLTKEHIKTNSDFSARIAADAPGLSTYEFLRRTSFEISPDFERMETLLRERLRQIASNSNSAYDTLWAHLDKLGGRIEDGNLLASTQHRLTKSDLKDILHRTGAMLVPALDVVQVRASFVSTSAIGRSWHRDISGVQVTSPALNELLSAIDKKKRSILLTGLPGSGKTCVMLSLQEVLEERAQTRTDIVPLFIQSREFVDLTTAQERQAQGLRAQWVEQAARLAEDTHLIVIIDSLDVLSIAREHEVLTYFLAQIDQLVLIPNITLITACRDFDRKYDRRIAARKWDGEVQCLPLDWETDIAPLLNTFDIDSHAIDAVTRELIRNPRELALFVELAQRNGSFSIITSQALAQRYLDTIVRADPTLGDASMQAIEGIANEMLRTRSLSIPHQRCGASQEIQRRLLSLNVLQETHDGKLTFGHQTLLDVLVISGAIRQGITLIKFIQALPPVPFVRPSIRSFVAQLATGDRREFRKQLRAVLTSNVAFHIRRLIAESFAQQIPTQDDWPLIRHLRDKHPEIFQVIYTQATLIEWHHFWFSHLVPMLKEVRDVERLTAHVHRVTQWVNEDTLAILKFWAEALTLNWLDGDRIAQQFVFSLSKIKTENLALLTPLLEQLISRPRAEHYLLGPIVARGVAAGVVDDTFLWRHIAGDITEEDVLQHHLDNKLHCQPHEFGGSNDQLLMQRMALSIPLLDLALEAIEQWSQIKSARYSETIIYRRAYLNHCSYADTHSRSDYRHIGSLRILLDAIEAAILGHAQKHSDWWQKNRERLCFNHEGALCYFAIHAFTIHPLTNIDLIGRLLCDRNLLEFELSYELSALISTAFIFLDSATQDAVNTTVQTVFEEVETAKGIHLWIVKRRTEYISAIPCHLRSETAQAILDAYATTFGTLISEPYIGSRGGMVTAPFPFDVFLSAGDDSVVRLLAHYTGYNSHFDDFLVGGEEQVGQQLSEAASRQPSRFLTLLTTEWANISEPFSDDIMDGLTNYLAYRYGNLQANDTWKPIEEPDAHTFANQLLDELERHPSHWRLNRSAAKAFKACAQIVQGPQNAERLAFLAIGFGYLHEESNVNGDSVDLLNSGINLTAGSVAEGLMILASRLLDQKIALPELITQALRLFARNEHPAIRALILSRLPYIQSQNPELGWELFLLNLLDSAGLWQTAERYLYCAYYNQFKKVRPLLELIYREGNNKDMETWGRISALSALAGHIELDHFLDDLNAKGITEAWQGAASVWTHTENIRQHREQCFAGIKAGFQAKKPHAKAVARHVGDIFRENTPPISVPVELLQLCFSVFESDNEEKHPDIFGFDEWLNATSQRDPETALATTEIYLGYVNRAQPYFYDHQNQLVQLVTRLFTEAEEREEYDNGAMLSRVVSVQDLLLTLGVNSMHEWLKAAERQ